MRWYIGQEVLALNSKGPLKQGKTYKIMGLEKAWCGCGHINIHVGIFMNGSRSCGECGSVQNKDVPEWWFHEKRFAPLDELMAEQIEELKLQLTH